MATYAELLEENAELRRQVATLVEIVVGQQRHIEQLERQIDELRGQSKRQAAPFSKGEPKAKPRRPGRKPGSEYGRQAVREIPERIDETIEVGCPVYCSHCHGQVTLEGKDRQYQVDLPPVQPRTIEFVLHWGRCQSCGRRVQGRHPRQVSDAVRVGQVHLGPGVVGLAATLQKVGGLSYGKITQLLADWMGLRVARSTLCRALARLAKKARPTYETLVETIRGSPVVYPDETGWRVGGLSAWLWAVTNGRETVYAIHRGRGYAEAASILGEDFSGYLVADGWAPYRCFEQATLQTCLAHLLRRCHEMLQTAMRGAVRFPRQVQAHLQHALALRDRRDAGEIGEHGLRVATGRLRASLRRIIRGNFTNPDNGRLARHHVRNENALFVFLDHPGIEATNWPSEHAIRPAVVNRKSAGGNRSTQGAETQAVLMSLLRTAHQKNLDPRSLFTAILQAQAPAPQPLLLG
ncbi:MAG: IS66 family transposase [Gammaproteobacteria bacterium]